MDSLPFLKLNDINYPIQIIYQINNTEKFLLYKKTTQFLYSLNAELYIEKKSNNICAEIIEKNLMITPAYRTIRYIKIPKKIMNITFLEKGPHTIVKIIMKYADDIGFQRWYSDEFTLRQFILFYFKNILDNIPSILVTKIFPENVIENKIRRERNKMLFLIMVYCILGSFFLIITDIFNMIIFVLFILPLLFYEFKKFKEFDTSIKKITSSPLIIT